MKNVDDDQDYDTRGDEMSLIAQEKYELEQFQNSLEGRLIEFTDQELLDEWMRRQFEPLNKAIKELSNKVDNLIPPF